MSTKIIRVNMTDAELIDEGLDCDTDSLAYRLAILLNAMPIYDGIVHGDDKECGSCTELKNEVYHLEYQVSNLESDIENLDIDSFNNELNEAKEAFKVAQEKLDRLSDFDLGGIK